MQEYQDVFERIEKKYLLSPEQYGGLYPILQQHMEGDRYGLKTVRNLYYDTPDARLIRTSLEKPLYKEKLRLRCYGETDDTAESFVELKKKFRGIVYKRRVAMRLAEAERYLDRRGPPPEPGQITREVDWLYHLYPGLAPAMSISYRRIALLGTEDPGLRLTLDRRILWRTELLDLRRGEFGQELLPPGLTLMEVKIPGAMPLWLAHALEAGHIYPVSYSKYGNAYLACQKQKGMKENACI